jgi:transcription elongation factor GreB
VSKAFTKDDGPTAAEVQRHRPPLPPGVPNYVTLRGLRTLRDELATLGHVPQGPDHHALAARRTELEQRIATAVLVPPPANRGEVRFGATVTVRDDDGNARVVSIVGVDESHPAAGLVAFVAPLARALLGHHVGDVVTVRAPGGEEGLAILSVDYDRE